MTNEEHAQIFGNNLKHIMYLRDMSQADLTRAMKTGSSTINTWYLGRQIPRADKLDQLCNILRCERGDLLENPDARTQRAYYAEKEDAKLAQEMLDRPELKTLMKAAKDCSPESIQAIMTLIQANTK